MTLFRTAKALARHTTRSRPTPDITIGPGQGRRPDYLRRWFVIPRNPLFNIYLHEFGRSDDDRALHDHPWVSLSILLQGEYTEHRIAAGGIHQRRVHRAGAVIWRGLGYPHRTELHAGPVQTLFITGPRVRQWGFHCPKGWRHWREFTDPTGRSVGRGCD